MYFKQMHYLCPNIKYYFRFVQLIIKDMYNRDKTFSNHSSWFLQEPEVFPFIILSGNHSHAGNQYGRGRERRFILWPYQLLAHFQSMTTEQTESWVNWKNDLFVWQIQSSTLTKNTTLEHTDDRGRTVSEFIVFTNFKDM